MILKHPSPCNMTPPNVLAKYHSCESPVLRMGYYTYQPIHPARFGKSAPLASSHRKHHDTVIAWMMILFFVWVTRVTLATFPS